MHICRFLLPMSRQLSWCTCRLGTVVQGATRGITTGVNHVKLGNDKDKKITKESYKEMEVFLGKWNLVKTTYYKGHKLAPTKNATVVTTGEPGMRFYLHYKKQGDLWTVETGNLDENINVVYTFRFDEYFVTNFNDGTYVETLVRPSGKLMIWAQIRQPSEDSSRISTEVRRNKLLWTSQNLNGTRFLRVYKKE